LVAPLRFAALMDSHGRGKSGPTNRGLPRALWWLIVLVGVLSVGASLALGVWSALGRQIDFDVYRMGGAHFTGPHLYSTWLHGARLQFTYPPFAAMIFWPFTRVDIRIGQMAWMVANLLALAALIAVSLRIFRRQWSPGRICGLALVLLLPVLLLEPDIQTLGFGQVNFFVVLLVVADLSCVVGQKGRRLPRGVLLGMAAAIKLTPLIFVPYLLLTRQFRAAATELGTFVACSMVAFGLSPHSSWRYWSKEVFDSKRAGNLAYVSDQNLRSALVRLGSAFGHSDVTDLLILLVAAGGLSLATWAYRRSTPSLGMLLCGVTGLLVSPISWSHHYVWIVPVLAWMLLGTDRPARGNWWALGTAAFFWASPIWWVHDRQHVHGGMWQFVLGDSFFLAAALFLVLVAVMLSTRRLRASRAGRLPGEEWLGESEHPRLDATPAVR
jgi:alpha-1,2-mannosyltransferase